MIRVFVVDDEKLVRRGIIGLIDWEKYGMEVVEAASGWLACGDVGAGKMPEPDELFQYIL